MNTETDSVDGADTAKQFQCQQLESVRRSRGIKNRAIAAAACTILVRPTIALHPDSAFNRGIVDRDGRKYPLLQAPSRNAVLAWFLQETHMPIQHVQDVFSPAMQSNESRIHEVPPEPAERSREALSQRFNGRLRVIARQAVTYWFSQDKLDKLLAQYVGSLEGCELLYAIDQSGRQISSNIHATSIDSSAFGQDLSRRPYSVSLSVLRNVAFHGAFACDAYLSQATQRPCVTVMYGVTSGSSLMGFIAADFYPAEE